MPIRSAAACLLVIQIVHASIPYTPTYIYPPSSPNGTFSYVLRPSGSAQNEIEFLSLNVSQVNSGDPVFSDLSSTISFSDGGGSFALVPTITSLGNLQVYAGDCQSLTSNGNVWTFLADNSSSVGNGTWIETPVQLSSGNGGSNYNWGGPGYLAAGFSYATSNDSSPSLYVFGGMCPSIGSSASAWITSANYSQTMNSLYPVIASDQAAYALGTIPSQSPPVAEAGFTSTPLTSNYATLPAGHGLQQQSFVLIGGHTSNAFINMSSLAVFSLPEAKWTYVDVKSPANTQIEPRSGHSAVLSSDGSQIIVYGGWVGDTNTLAEPRLLILELGNNSESLSTTGWEWTVPGQVIQTKSPGLFAHGAAMLPGNVMFLTGGYQISSSSKKRSSGFTMNSQLYMYNVSSGEWLSSYTAPISQNHESSPQDGLSPGGPLSSAGQKAGLIVGLVIAVGVLVFLSFLVGRRRAHREERTQHLRRMALGADTSRVWDGGRKRSDDGYEYVDGALAPPYGPPMVERRVLSVQGYVSNSAPRISTERGYNLGSGQRHSAAYEAERTGLLVEVPSPTRGLRRSMSRPHKYQSIAYYDDDSPANNGAGLIHPIDERDEYEDMAIDDVGQNGEQHDSYRSALVDPFLDTHQPQKALTGHVRGLSEEIKLPSPYDSVRSESPIKTERTHSGLSESSAQSIGSIQRSHIGSVRKGRTFHGYDIPVLEPSLRPSSAATGRLSPGKDGDSSDPSGRRAKNYLQSVVFPFEGSRTADSLSTDDSSTKQSQIEGEGLLFGDGSEWATPPESPTRPARSASTKSITLSWMGSVRRSIFGSKKNSDIDRYNSPSPTNQPEAQQIQSSRTTPPLLHRGPERTMTASSITHFRQKQGPHDWSFADNTNSKRAVARNSSTRRPPSDLDQGLPNIPRPGQQSHDYEETENGDEEEWDVEAAAEGRLVQVTYTIPKERLRVVNVGVGEIIGDGPS